MGRDRGCCVAVIIDPKEMGHCYDKWGEPMAACDSDKLEADYVRLGATAPRHQAPEDHVMLCPGHHRGTGPQGGAIWANAHRWEQREYLNKFVVEPCEDCPDG